MIGSVIDKFEVLQKIGEGGMATVYRGRHTALGRDVAIKVLHPHLSRSDRNRKRFAREARAIEHLTHDNILEIFDYSGTEVDDCYIVTEFVDGANLHQLLTQHGSIPSEVVLRIGYHLSDALAYAHGLGIIHRDLKPENVMIRRDGAIKLMDFGIARFLDEVHLTMTGALVGSPAYMSPEQAMEKVLDERSDLFSLGTLLFHLLTGSLPFSGSNPSIILRNIIEGDRPDVLSLAPSACGTLARIIEELMQTNPDDRPPSASALHLRFSEAMNESGIELEQVGWSVRDWLENPATYDERRVDWLRVHLYEQGRELLEAGEQLRALSLLNRLLAIDEDHPEVLTLLRGMHDRNDTGTTSSTKGRASRTKPMPKWAPVILLLFVATLTVLLWPESNLNSNPSPTAPTATVSRPVLDDTLPEENTSEAQTDTTPPIVEPAKTNQLNPRLRTEASPPMYGPDPRPQTIESPAPIVDVARPNDGIDSETITVSVEEPPDPGEADVAESGFLIIRVEGNSTGDIYIDQEHRGSVGSDPSIEVSAGIHHIRVVNDRVDTVPWAAEMTVEVEAGQTREVVLPPLTREASAGGATP